MGPQALPSGVFISLYPNMFGLIVGRSSATMQGLQIFPGVIENDYQGKIKVMAKAIHNIVTICLLHPLQ
jgi:dUTPase